MASIKLVIFDFDDTLCMTEEARFKLENYVAEELGMKPMTHTTHIKYWGQKTLDKSIQDRIPGIVAKAFMKKLAEIQPLFIKRGELDAVPRANIYTIGVLRNRGIRTALLTSRSFMETQHLMEPTYPLNGKIEKFYHKENTEYIKPNPKVFDKTLSDFAVKPHETCYIGDNANDAKAANGAGLQFIAVLESGLKTKEDFKDFHVDYFAKTFPDILNYFNFSDTQER